MLTLRLPPQIVWLLPWTECCFLAKNPDASFLNLEYEPFAIQVMSQTMLLKLTNILRVLSFH